MEGTDAAYPREWETTAVLKDGATVEVRPIRAADRDALARFHGRQSQESIYFRFFRYRPELSEEELSYFTEIDYRSRMAFVALLDGEIVAVARYECDTAANRAEVAFFVDDDHHGRGLATLMLEYLAEAGRREGLDGFTATVMSENYRMLRVFRSAGFDVRTKFDDGAIAVELGLTATPEVQEKIDDRDRRGRVASVRRVFSPTSVCVVGASRTPGTVGHEFVRSVVESGFAGSIVAVNPNASDRLAGAPAVATVSEAGPIDLAVIAVPAEQVQGVAADCVEQGARTLLVASAGFSDAGPDGVERELELLGLVRRHGVRLVGPLSYGLVNTDDEHRLSCEFFPVPVDAGDVAVLSQSGPLGAALLGHLNERGIGISTFLSLGNRADLSANDLLEFWADDARTTVGALYLENLGNPRKFLSTGRRLSRRKPVVSIRPADDRHRVVAGAAGLILVNGVRELLDQVALVDRQPVPRGRRVGIVSNMPSVARLVAAGCRRGGLDVSTETSVPFDAADLLFEDRIVATAVSDEVDAVIVAISPTLQLPARATARILDDVDRAIDKPLVGVNLTGVPSPAGLPTFAFPDEATRALARYVDYGAWLASADSPELVLDDSRRDALRSWVEDVLAERTRLEFETGSEAMTHLIDEWGVPVLSAYRASTADDAVAAADELGWPVAVKASWIAPRTPGASGGTALDVGDADTLRTVLRQWDFGDEREVVIQPMAAPGLHVAVTVEQSLLGGAVMAVWLGGAAAAGLEPLGQCVLPATEQGVADLAASADMLSEPARDRLVELLATVARIAVACQEIVSWRLNPILVSDDVALAVDSSLVLEARPADPLEAVRHL